MSIFNFRQTIVYFQFLPWLSLTSLRQANPLFHSFFLLLLFVPLLPLHSFYIHLLFILGLHASLTLWLMWSEPVSPDTDCSICEHNHVHTSPTLARSCSISLVHVVWTPIKRLNHSFLNLQIKLRGKQPLSSGLEALDTERIYLHVRDTAKILSSWTKQGLKCHL